MPKRPEAEKSVIVVDPEDQGRYEFLRQVFESDHVQVVRDRRKADRPQRQDPRAGGAATDRRRAPKPAKKAGGGFEIHKRQTD